MKKYIYALTVCAAVISVNGSLINVEASKARTHVTKSKKKVSKKKVSKKKVKYGYTISGKKINIKKAKAHGYIYLKGYGWATKHQVHKIKRQQKQAAQDDSNQNDSSQSSNDTYNNADANTTSNTDTTSNANANASSNSNQQHVVVDGFDQTDGKIVDLDAYRSAYRAAALKQINALRASLGVAPLQDNADLDKVADVRVQQNIDLGNMSISHYDSNGNFLGDSVAKQLGVSAPDGENLAASGGDLETPQSAAHDLTQMYIDEGPDKGDGKEHGHYQSLVNPSYGSIGIGFGYTNSSDYGAVTYDAEDFADQSQNNSSSSSNSPVTITTNTTNNSSDNSTSTVNSSDNSTSTAQSGSADQSTIQASDVHTVQDMGKFNTQHEKQYDALGQVPTDTPFMTYQANAGGGWVGTPTQLGYKITNDYFYSTHHIETASDGVKIYVKNGYHMVYDANGQGHEVAN
ncbi:CAP domain-containing protein [Nicoliella lavandulae]|uniref:CAP domain-containing protein n=1 Tax=Nicoliella lavandulae TaxID=3082954 RepID=A0ABU8SIV7_9LACO